MKQYEDVIKELDADIPASAVASRDAGQGRKLSYLTGWYVIDRLNKVLGIGNWAYGSDVMLLFADKVGDKFSVHYSAKVRFVVTIGTVQTEFIDYGYGDGSDKYNIGKAHELAIKEAVTDGIKRCAKNLGMSMGLALYDKDQEHVADVPKPKAAAKEGAKEAATKKIILDKAGKAVENKKMLYTDLNSRLKSDYKIKDTGSFSENLKMLSETQASEFLTYLTGALS